MLIEIGPGAKPSDAFAELAAGMPVLTVLGYGVYRDLLAEIGSAEGVMRWAMALASRTDRPVLFNLPDGPKRSITVAIPPPHWPQERPEGYLAGRHEEIEDAYGPITQVQAHPARRG